MSAPALARVDVEREVLRAVESLAAELGTLPERGRVTLDDALDRDLGFGSLERVELIARLEDALGARLADTLTLEAEHVRDLVAAVLAARPPGVTLPPPAPAAVPGAGRPAPAAASTLVEVLAWHAGATPDRVHVILLDEDGREQRITYGALRAEAAAVGAALRQRGVRPGASVALMLRTERGFFAAFFGVLLAGAVPVPIYPPWRADRLEEYARRQVGILSNARAQLLVTFAEARAMAGLLRRRVPGLKDVVALEALAGEGAAGPPVTVPAKGPALIQYTSGSTGDPKGVLLSHANILANIRAFGQALGIHGDDVGVSWLPLYHDMGLIGTWLGALYHGVPLVLMPPLAFLARPARWLQALGAYRGTVSAAPNFAFDLCVRRVSDEEMAEVDLSAWRLALNGSEPVSPESIERFTRRFARWGFRPEAMCPVYGLAESAVAFTVPPPGRGPRVDAISREIFERERRAVPAPAEASALRIVSCGRPIPGHAVRVVDEHGREVPERVEGRIELRGPSVTGGYFKNVEATRAVIRNGWLDSGDLGYLADGELFVTGRRKDVIIKAGRNVYPQEVEELAGEVPGIRKGCVAAFGVPDPAIGTERLVVVAESRQSSGPARDRLRGAVTERVAAALGLPPDFVVIAPPGAVLKTSSGKIHRAATRQAYLSGTLGRHPSARMQWVRLAAGDVGARLARAGRAALHLLFAVRAGLVLALTLPPLWLLVTLLPAGRAVERVVRTWCRLILHLAGCPPAVTGLERLPAAGPVVLAANHASYLDAVVLLAAVPRPIRFVAKRELLRTPLVGRIIRKVGHLPVERADVARSAADADRVSAALQTGTWVVFFPEGTFRRAPGLLPFRLGAFKAAVEARCPVLPIAIRGTRQILPADTWLPRPGTLEVVIGALRRPAGSDWRDIVALRDATRAAIAQALGEEER